MLQRARGWFVLAGAFLLFSGIYSGRAPCGHWMNSVFGSDLWLENDPGAYYVASAHELQWGGSPLYIGHPGATLTPLLLAVQRIYALRAPEGTSFTRFTARHLPHVFLLSKLLMTLLHLASFAALYALSARLLRDRRAAGLAVIGYATSFPVLYYLSRISVEPLMVAFFAAGFVAVWSHQDRLAEGRTGAALVYAALAALAAVSGAMTKLVFLGPLPFFLLLYLVTGRARASWRVRIAAVCVFVAVGLASLLLYSGIVDWRQFFEVWSAVAARPGPVRIHKLTDFLPGLGSGQVFLSAELAFWAIGAAGWVCFLRAHRKSADRALWLSAYVAFAVLVFANRVRREGSFLPFNYAFLPQAGASVFFGFALAELWRRLGLSRSGRRGAIAGLACILALHGFGAWAVIDARRFDAAFFDEGRAALELVAQLRPSERIAIEVEPGGASQAMARLAILHGMTFPYQTPRRSVLADAFAELFLPIRKGAVQASLPRTPVPALGADLVVVREPRSAP